MPVSPTIQLTFRGILVVSLDREHGVCQVGFLNEPPSDHILTIDITRRTATGTSQIIRQLTKDHIPPGGRLRLDVQNVSHPGISTFEQLNFNRGLGLGDALDFRWAVDYRELFEAEPEVNPAGFRAILSINNGTFFNEKRSADELIFKPLGSGAASRVHGRVSTAIGAQISLDREDSRAVFMNGDEKVFECLPVPGVIYAINVSQSPPVDVPEVPTSPDANAYQTVFNPPQEHTQVEFLLPPPSPHATAALVLPVSEHAVCFTAVTTRSLG